MTDHTAPALLEAVGIDWRHKYGEVRCPECRTVYVEVIGRPQHTPKCCSRPDMRKVEPTYTGPGLGTPELDKELLVAGQRWCATQKDPKVHGSIYTNIEMHFPGYEVTECYGPLDWLLFISDLPGHALARAIAEVES